MDLDAIVLAGGTGRRLGGQDKGGLDVGGVTLLDRVLAASAQARHTVVVGSRRRTVRAVTWTLESPAGGGPLAGLIAGLAALRGIDPQRSCPVLVLATDLPRLRVADVGRLSAALDHQDDEDDEVEGAAFSDDGGRLQPLAALYRRAALGRALAPEGAGTGRPMRLLLQRLRVVAVPDLGAAEDCDTPDQLARHRRRSTIDG